MYTFKFFDLAKYLITVIRYLDSKKLMNQHVHANMPKHIEGFHRYMFCLEMITFNYCLLQSILLTYHNVVILYQQLQEVISLFGELIVV